MRVISGSRKGQRLATVRGRRVRPTTDRTRELIFNVVGERVRESSVLDVFAGTGSLGIEALSRGALKAVFVENDSQALKVLFRNLEATAFAERAVVLARPAERALKQLGREKAQFDLILADPPYRTGWAEQTLATVEALNLLAEGGWLIIEHASEVNLPKQRGSIALHRCRKVGDSTVSFFQHG